MLSELKAALNIIGTSYLFMNTEEEGPYQLCIALFNGMSLEMLLCFSSLTATIIARSYAVNTVFSSKHSALSRTVSAPFTHFIEYGIWPVFIFPCWKRSFYMKQLSYFAEPLQVGNACYTSQGGGGGGEGEICSGILRCHIVAAHDLLIGHSFSCISLPCWDISHQFNSPPYRWQVTSVITGMVEVAVLPSLFSDCIKVTGHSWI